MGSRVYVCFMSKPKYHRPLSQRDNKTPGSGSATEKGPHRGADRGAGRTCTVAAARPHTEPKFSNYPWRVRSGTMGYSAVLFLHSAKAGPPQR